MEKWYYYLRHASETTKEEYERLVEGAPMLRRAYDKLERCSWSEVELNTYEQFKKRALDNVAALHCKLQEGRQEEKIEIAKNMLSRKRSVELIAGVTGLSLEQISELK